MGFFFKFAIHFFSNSRIQATSRMRSQSCAAACVLFLSLRNVHRWSATFGLIRCTPPARSARRQKLDTGSPDQSTEWLRATLLSELLCACTGLTREVKFEMWNRKVSGSGWRTEKGDRQREIFIVRFYRNPTSAIASFVFPVLVLTSALQSTESWENLIRFPDSTTLWFSWSRFFLWPI